MNGRLLPVLLLIFSFTSVFAQGADEYEKKEFFAGYSGNYTVSDEFVVIGRGFNLAGVYNFRRYLGIKGDVSATYGGTRRERFVPGFDNPGALEVSYKTRTSIYNVVAGIQAKENSTEAKIKPFAHGMVGIGQHRVDVREASCRPPLDCRVWVPVEEKNTGLSIVLGAGLDIKINDKIDLRVVQFDLNPIFFERSAAPYRSGIGAFRFSAGIVFK